jgi:hypothetical protein
MRRAASWIVGFGVLLAGCGGESEADGRTSAIAVADTPSASAASVPDEGGRMPMWSEAGLEAQPRIAELRRATPPELGFDPGSTAWAPVDHPRIEVLESLTFDTPAGAALATAAALGWDASLGTDVWEWTVRVWLDSPERAVAVVLGWGFQDDSVAGQDLRVAMEREDDGWRVESVRRRSHCARGVADGDLCI